MNLLSQKIAWPMMFIVHNTSPWEICLAPEQVLDLEVCGVPVSLILQLTR
jgi:hypothetical protein